MRNAQSPANEIAAVVESAGAAPALARIAAAIAPSRAEFVDALTAATRREIPELDHVDDRDSAEMLRASIADNVSRLVEIFVSGADPRGGAPAAAADYARRLAHRRASLASLLRAYRIGQAAFTAHCLELVNSDVEEVPAPVQIAMVNAIAAYIDAVCEQVAEAYQAEHERWVSGQQGLRQLWVARVLAGTEVDLGEARSALRYDLAGRHLAAEIWADAGLRDDGATAALDDTVEALRSQLGNVAVLVVAQTDRHLRVWFGVTRRGDDSITDLALSAGVRVALGTPDVGASGFRDSSRRATRGRELSVGCGPSAPRLVRWRDVAAASMLVTGPDAALAVRSVLGPLAVDATRRAELRATLRVFLEHNRSYATAADVLGVHRNTVRYRVDQALELCGVEPDGNTLALLAALTAAHWAPGLLAER